MKTAVLSDIHVDINRDYPVAQEFARYIKEQGARLAIIAGDVSESQQETLDTLNTIEQLSGARVLFVPGNHDLWGPKGDPDQIGAIYSRYAQDEHCLCGRDVVLGDTVVIGDVGWYDYSFGSGRYSFEEFEKMSLAAAPGRIPCATPGPATTWAAPSGCSPAGGPHGRLPGEEAGACHPHAAHQGVHRAPGDGQLVLLQRLFGHRRLGELYRRYPVEVAICGHVHYRKTLEKDGITWMCRCLNYHSEWRPEYGGDTLSQQIAHAAEVMEL